MQRGLHLSYSGPRKEDPMSSHGLTFGVFVPQGWKMELASIEDPQAKWAKAVEIAQLAEELGFDSLWVYDHFHNVPRPAHEAMFECWTTLAAISQRRWDGRVRSYATPNPKMLTMPARSKPVD